MKYGIMYYKATDNLGDDIQTYAAIKYIPHIDYYVDRESLSCFVPNKKEPVAMIMNGWYIHNKIAWPPSPFIVPLLISMHFKNLELTDVGDSYLKGLGGEFLKKNGPVGARDLETEKRLKKNGIPAYFSGCLTLTLDRFDDVKKKDKICLVDVSDEVVNKVKENTDYEIEILTHCLNSKETEKRPFKARMNDVEEILKKYQEAHLVITTRLHAALPCVALGTPVIVLHKNNYDEDRLKTFFDYFQNYEEKEFLEKKIKDILKNPKPNEKDYLKIKKFLEKKCRKFIMKPLKKLKNLPEIEEYGKYAKKIKWYKHLFEKERIALENLEERRVNEYFKYHKEIESLNYEIANLLMDKKTLESKIELQKSELEQSKKELSKIYNSKGWKYLERLRNFL